MIVSALLTSVGINSGLCILFFALYSILRKQPGYSYVYVPRLLAAKGIERNRYIHLQRLLPSPSWVKRAWKLSEEELLSTSGLDAVVFIRTIRLSLKIFSFAGVIGLFVLLPINCAGTQLASFDITVISSEKLDLFTISNVNNGSKWLWAHCSAVYLITGFVCFLLYYEYDYICSKRNAYFYSSKPEPHQFTILVRGIPVPPGSSISESVESFFKEYHSSTYMSHVVIHRTHKISNIIIFVKNLYRRLRHLHSEADKVYSRGDGYSGVSLRDPALDNLSEEQSLSVQEVRSAFVSFRSRFGAAIASRLQQSEKPTEWVTEQAPEPNDVYWPFFHSTFLQRWMSKVVIIVTSIVLTVLFLIPVAIVQGLANLSQLEFWFPFLKSILSAPIISRIVTGYLPNLILQLSLKLVPPVMEFLSSIQGYISYSEIQRSACDKFLWFIIWNIFFTNVLSGSFLNPLFELLDLRNIPEHLAVAVPAQFINVYAPKFESAGKFWPTVHNSMIFSLVLMHAIAVGIFTLKKFSCASWLIFPLPVLTLLFNEYCRKRFLPNFAAYSVESLIRKDREDLNDPEVPQFFRELVTAYVDPALSPLKLSDSSGHRAPPSLSDISDDDVTPLLSQSV
ncbi:CSC1-like protein At1g69450 isoform X2 [Beta vulgaris subsp. vulgaris]|uniref:CSC1-like protein At1g69450 isoform X2 n=1 Tax=Beta vulgaris subsp. vulgaris TaxID=3555 RepID=UPI002036FFE0|nr:CSC1-like protein At1g69450 isoform X2 [Beta vulgaris subsp. vulgaris]